MVTYSISSDNRKSNSFVSIIIPCYLREIELVKELINQLSSIKDDVEIVFAVDGYANDDLFNQFLKEASNINNCVVALHERNAGVSAARNTGISISNGKYVLFVDADDLIDTSVLSKAINVAIANDEIDILCMRMKDFDPSQSPQYKNNVEILDAKLVDASTVFDDYLYFDKTLDDYMFRSSCGKLIRTDLITENNVSFVEGLKHFEDALFIKQCVRHTEKLYLLEDGNFYFYRVNNASASRSYSADLEEQFGLYFNKCSELQILSKGTYLDSAYLFLIDLTKNLYVQKNKLKFSDIKKIFDINYIKSSLFELKKIDLNGCINKFVVRMKKIIIFKTLLFAKIYFYNFAKKYIVRHD